MFHQQPGKLLSPNRHEPAELRELGANWTKGTMSDVFGSWARGEGGRGQGGVAFWSPLLPVWAAFNLSPGRRPGSGFRKTSSIYGQRLRDRPSISSWGWGPGGARHQGPSAACRDGVRPRAPPGDCRGNRRAPPPLPRQRPLAGPVLAGTKAHLPRVALNQRGGHWACI